MRSTFAGTVNLPISSGAGQGLLSCGMRFAGLAEAGLAGGAAASEVIERFRVAELVARPLELGFLSLPPEFFRALHAAVDSFHFGIAQHRGQRKADAAPAWAPRVRFISSTRGMTNSRSSKQAGISGSGSLSLGSTIFRITAGLHSASTSQPSAFA